MEGSEAKGSQLGGPGQCSAARLTRETDTADTKSFATILGRSSPPCTRQVCSSPAVRGAGVSGGLGAVLRKCDEVGVGNESRFAACVRRRRDQLRARQAAGRREEAFGAEQQPEDRALADRRRRRLYPPRFHAAPFALPRARARAALPDVAAAAADRAARHSPHSAHPTGTHVTRRPPQLQPWADTFALALHILVRGLRRPNLVSSAAEPPLLVRPGDLHAAAASIQRAGARRDAC